MSLSISVITGKYHQRPGKELSGVPVVFTPEDFSLTEHTSYGLDGFPAVLSFLNIDQSHGRLVPFDLALGNEATHGKRAKGNIPFFQSVSDRFGYGKPPARDHTQASIYETLCNSSNVIFSREELVRFPYYMTAKLLADDGVRDDEEGDNYHEYLPHDWFDMLTDLNLMKADFVIFSIC